MDVSDRIFVIEAGWLIHEAACAYPDAGRIQHYLSCPVGVKPLGDHRLRWPNARQMRRGGNGHPVRGALEEPDPRLSQERPEREPPVQAAAPRLHGPDQLA